MKRLGHTIGDVNVPVTRPLMSLNTLKVFIKFCPALLSKFHASCRGDRIRELQSNNDGDGSEIVTIKTTSISFKVCCVYSNSFKMSNESEFPRNSILGDRTQV